MKSKGRIMTRLAILLVLLAAGCGEKELPPGYKQVCNPQGYYAFEDDQGHVCQYYATKSRARMVKYAWYWKDFQDSPLPRDTKYDGPWEECDR